MPYKIKPDYVYIVVFALFVVGGPIRYGLEQFFADPASEVRLVQE
jgi:hypothetical protein